MNFPFEFYHYDKNSDYFVVPFHCHESQQLVRIIQGQVSITANSQTITLREGDCCILGSNVVHCCIPCSDDTVFESVTFNLRDLFDLSQPHYLVIKMVVTHQLEFNLFYNRPEDDEIRARIQAMFDALEDNGICSTMKLIGKIIDIFTAAIDFDDYTLYDNEDANRLFKYYSKSTVVFKYILEHYGEEISLEGMASSINLSEKYFCKFFKEMTGFRPMEFLNRFRIEAAAIELRTDLTESINDIAQRCGFKDPCYFTKLFKRIIGLSPREYREPHIHHFHYLPHHLYD
ncbi:MAG: helix-turn-helix domain-containing protein [Succinivibrio sp.]